jgi:hypothetical protein
VSAPGRVLLFHVGARLFAADVADVLRIAPGVRHGGGPLAETALGSAHVGARGLVVRDGSAERVVAVDGVLGVRALGPGELHALPALAAACLATGAVRGLVLLEGAPTPLVDLPTLVREGGPAAASAREGAVHA